MSKVSISIYSLRLRDIQIKGKKEKSYIDLNKSFESRGVLDILKELFNSLNMYKDIEDVEKIFKVEECSEIKTYYEKKVRLYKYINLKVSSGSYGDESNIIGKEDNELKYSRKPNDAEVMSFRIQVAIPLGKSTRGIVLFENIGNKGVKSIFFEEVNQYIIKKISSYRLEMNTLSTNDYLKRLFREAKLNSFTFIGYAKSNNKDENLNSDRGVISFKESEYKLKKPITNRVNFNNRVFAFLDGTKDISDIIEIEDHTYENIKIDLTSGEDKRIIDFKNIRSVLISENVSKDVIVNKKIDDDKLLNKINELSNFYLKEMKLIR